MLNKKTLGITVAGFCAGAVNGLFGAAGGMVLVPLLTALTEMEEQKIFPTSISIIVPICLASLMYTAITGNVDIVTAFPYLIGSALGGIAAGRWGGRIPAIWLHRGLGILIICGGFRYLW